MDPTLADPPETKLLKFISSSILKSVAVAGAAIIREGSGVPIFAANITASVDVNETAITVSGIGDIQINTSSSTTYLGVAPSSFMVASAFLLG